MDVGAQKHGLPPAASPGTLAGNRIRDRAARTWTGTHPFITCGGLAYYITRLASAKGIFKS